MKSNMKLNMILGLIGPRRSSKRNTSSYQSLFEPYVRHGVGTYRFIDLKNGAPVWKAIVSVSIAVIISTLA